MQLVSGAGRIFFKKQLNGLQFLTLVDFFIRFTVFARGLSCLHIFLLRREQTTIMKGQRLGTVHIMERACSRLRFS